MTPHSILTQSGLVVDLLNPSPDTIVLEDIAWSLAHQCRWTGHTDEFYSVARHSLIVASAVPPEYALCALMHDATEAYLGDVSRPLKTLLPAYADLEAAMWAVIAQKFGLPAIIPEAVHMADNEVLAWERWYFMLHAGHEPVPEPTLRPHFYGADSPPDTAEAFLKRFVTLTKRARP